MLLLLLSTNRSEIPIIPTVLCIGGVICHSQLSDVLIKPELLQERCWKCLFGLLIALAGWNPFHPHWNVNCPFPFPSDQGGIDKTNCRPVILSTQGPTSQSTPDNYNNANTLTACIDSSRHLLFGSLGKAALCACVTLWGGRGKGGERLASASN